MSVRFEELDPSRRERPDTFASIGARAKRILRGMDEPHHLDARRARRRRAESWLHRQGLIEVFINHQRVTPFSPKMGHDLPCGAGLANWSSASDLVYAEHKCRK